MISNSLTANVQALEIELYFTDAKKLYLELHDKNDLLKMTVYNIIQCPKTKTLNVAYYNESNFWKFRCYKHSNIGSSISAQIHDKTYY